MKTKKRFFGRRSRARSTENPKRTQTSPSRSEDEEYSIEKEPDALPQPNKSEGKETRSSIARKDSVKLDGAMADPWKSFDSDGSNETTASDMMKCLNALRIQDASVTNSTPTPSAASVPRLAPPPLSREGSMQNGTSQNTPMTEHLQSWPNLQTKSLGRRSRENASPMSVSETRIRDFETPKQSSSWVAFESEGRRKATLENAGTVRARSVSVHATSPGLETPFHSKKNSVVDDDFIADQPPVKENAHTEPPENNSTSETTVTLQPVPGTTSWEDFEDTAFKPHPTLAASAFAAGRRPSDHPNSVETVLESSGSLSQKQPHKAMRPPPKPPIMRSPVPLQKTGSSTRSGEATPSNGTKGAVRNPWVDSDDDAASLPVDSVSEDNPFAVAPLHKRYSSGCSLASKSGDSAFHAILAKHGSPLLELVETVNASFSGNKLTRYSVWGEVKFKLSGAGALSTQKDPPHLSARAVESLDLYHLVLRLKCVLNHVFLKHVIAKKTLMEWDDQRKVVLRQSSLTMNEARKGLVESKIMHWNLARCYQEALSNPVTLLRYPVQPNTLSGPPLRIQIQWQKPKKSGHPVLVDVSITPNQKLSASLWGVTVCLMGFGCSSSCVEAQANPEARWNPVDGTFEWSIPIINPDDAARHLRVKVIEKSEGECPDHNLSASVKFVMPHATLSGTLLLGWIERKDDSQSEPLFVEDSASGAAGMNETDLIFCEKMCLSGNYGADINY